MKKSVVLTGALAAIVASAQPVVEAKETKPKEKKAKRVPQCRVFDKDGNIVLIDETPESSMNYLEHFMALTVKPTAGYDSFVTREDGFTNPIKFRRFTPQGVAKMLAVLTLQAELLIAGGSEEMANILKGMKKLPSQAKEMAAKIIAQDQLNIAFQEVVDATGSYEQAVEKLSDYAKENGLELPPEKVAEAEAEAENESELVPA